MSKSTRRIGAAATVVALVGGILGIWASPAQAAVFNVTTTEYKYDGVCDDHCSLLDAVYTANGLPGAHTVFVPTGVYPLTGGPLTIWSNVTIQSVGGQATLDAESTGRVVKVNKEGNATFKGFLITRGRVSDGGAGILNEGTLNLVDSIVNASTSSISCGGGLNNLGTAYLSGSVVSSNSAPLGAGICNGPTSSLYLDNTRLAFNQATGNGGAIYSTGTAVLRQVQLGNNLAAYGGAIFNDGVLTVSRSLITQNEAMGGDGGGVYNLDTAEITDSRITDNDAGAGGGIANRFVLDVVDSTVQGNTALFGGGISNSSVLEVTNSTLADNSAKGFDGGGLSNYANAATTISNSTFSGNTAGNDGGAVHQSSATVLSITSSTIVDNAADDDTSNGGRGGGIHVSGAGVSVQNSIVAGNRNPAGATSSPDCFGPLVSTGYNIIGDLDNCYVTLLESDGTGVPQFGPLANNGGPTPTHALRGELGAVDNGPTGAACTGTDQRGVPRVSPCDTGAYELVDCGGLPVNVVGTAASENLEGTGKADGILALGGADRVRSRGGNDRVCGGGGADELTGGQGRDLLNGGPGKDLCVGGPGKDTYRSCERRR